jgi:hypothetical protein
VWKTFTDVSGDPGSVNIYQIALYPRIFVVAALRTSDLPTASIMEIEVSKMETGRTLPWKLITAST